MGNAKRCSGRGLTHLCLVVVPGTWRPGREELGSGERWMTRERFLALLCAGIKKSAALPKALKTTALEFE